MSKPFAWQLTQINSLRLGLRLTMKTACISSTLSVSVGNDGTREKRVCGRPQTGFRTLTCYVLPKSKITVHSPVCSTIPWASVMPARTNFFNISSTSKTTSTQMRHKILWPKYQRSTQRWIMVPRRPVFVSGEFNCNPLPKISSK